MCLIEHLLSPGLSSVNSVFQRLLSVIVFVSVFPGGMSFLSLLPGQCVSRAAFCCSSVLTHGSVF